MTTTAVRPLVSAPSQGIALLEDKLRIPRPGLAVLPRARIGALMDAAVTRRVTLMTGPPGAGKTMAAALWAAGRPVSRRPGWVSIDAGDVEPGRFWRYVAAALSKTGAIPGAKAGLPAGMAAAEIPPWISAKLRPGGEPVVLVLDDVHLLAGSDSLAGLDELVRHEPAGLRLVLVGRSAPGLTLSRLRLEGELADIGAADLACTADEMAAYFKMLGTPLGRAEQDQLLRQTEGWLAGLRLTALARQAIQAPQTPQSPSAPEASAASVATAVTGQAGVQALVADYLEDEVLSRPVGRRPRVHDAHQPYPHRVGGPGPRADGRDRSGAAARQPQPGDRPRAGAGARTLASTAITRCSGMCSLSACAGSCPKTSRSAAPRGELACRPR